jgi:hypothetical protein
MVTRIADLAYDTVFQGNAARLNCIPLADVVR